MKFFRVVGSMVSQAVKVTRMAEAEKRRLVEENAHLREELRDRYDFRHIIGTSGPIASVRAGRAGRAHEHDGARSAASRAPARS